MATLASEQPEQLNILYQYFTKQETYINPQLSESIVRQLKSKPDEDATIIKELGRGATGVVYKISRGGLKDVCAMKKIRVDHLTKFQQSQKLKEVLLMQGLEHPNIIHYISSYLEDNELCIIMELATYGDLAQVSIRQNLSS